MQRFLTIRLALISALALSFCLPLWAQGQETTSVTIDGATISVVYGRPDLHGRSKIHDMLPVGRIWRLGRNQATIFKTETDLTFGDKTVEKGSYSLFARKVGTDEWRLVINKQTGQWGTQYDQSQDLLSIPMTAKKLDDSVDKFTIELDAEGHQGSLTIIWGVKALAASFSAS